MKGGKVSGLESQPPKGGEGSAAHAPGGGGGGGRARRGAPPPGPAACMPLAGCRQVDSCVHRPTGTRRPALKLRAAGAGFWGGGVQHSMRTPGSSRLGLGSEGKDVLPLNPTGIGMRPWCCHGAAGKPLRLRPPRGTQCSLFSGAPMAGVGGREVCRALTHCACGAALQAGTCSHYCFFLTVPPLRCAPDRAHDSFCFADLVTCLCCCRVGGRWQGALTAHIYCLVSCLLRLLAQSP